MPRVDVILDMEPDYILDGADDYNKKIKRSNEKTIKIDGEIFKLAFREGYIEKTKDGYVFVGKQEDLAAFKKKKD